MKIQNSPESPRIPNTDGTVEGASYHLISIVVKM